MGSNKDLKALENFLTELGPSPAVERFLRGYGNPRTKCAYAMHLALYLRWLKSKGISTTPDELIADNLKAVFQSAPTDVTAKRKHLDLLSEYVNGHLFNKNAGDSTRGVAAAAISVFYRSNDSALFGYWKLAENKPQALPPPLFAEDIRKVLLAMPVKARTPLLLSWQTSIEINRVLGMDWSFALDREPPVRIELNGRKLHRKTYSTFMGAESVEHLRLMGPKMPNYSTVLKHLHFAARKLGAAGLLKNPKIESWHPHALRHSFETEATHAGVPKEVRGYFEGHLADIMYVYSHTDTIHPEDLVNEWQKIEPFVSLEPDKATLQNQFAEREKSLVKRFEAAESLLSELRLALGVSQKAPTPTPQ